MRDLYAPIVRHISLPLWGMRQGNPYQRYIPEHLRNSRLPIEQLKDLQWQRLKAILEHAYNNTVYYREAFDDLRLRPSDIRSLEDMLALPVLTSTKIRERQKDFLATNYRVEDLIRTYTGGSTGIPMEFYRDRRCQGMRNAATACFEMRLGYHPGDKRALIWVAYQDLDHSVSLKSRIRRLLVDRRIELNTKNLDMEKTVNFARLLDRFNPALVAAIPTGLYSFARLLKASGEPIPKMPAVVTTADYLSTEAREFIQQTLHCELFDRYGSRELGEIGMECSYHHGYHLDMQSHYVEILRDGRPALPGEVGEVVVTDLLNHGMPFIRYKQSDLAVATDVVCPCGWNTPMIDSIQGRVCDTLVSRKGTLVASVAFVPQLAKLEYGVKQIQIIQEELTKLKVRLAVESNPDNAQKFIREALQTTMGSDVEIVFELVDSIPSEASGKYRYAISKLTQDELDDAFRADII